VVLHEKASIIQGHWRCFTSCIKYRLMVGDIITVQSVIRRHLAIQARRNQSIAAAKIQSLFRGHAVRSSLAIYHCHASVIQSAFRGFMARISYSLDIIDIVTIQSLARRWLARRIVGKRQSSLLKIQSVTRRWIGYRRVSSLRIHVERERTESNMACKIQACYIGYKTRRAISVRNEKATLIQTAFRGFFARSSFMADRLDIVAVQSLARRWLVRQSMSMQQESAIMLQSIVRQRIATQKVAHLKMMKSLKYRQSHSSTLIQSLWRGHRDRQIAAEHAAARKIQKTWRCFVTHIDFLVQVMSVLSMQACVRRFLAQRSYEKRYQNLVRLQAFFRGNIVRCELRRKNQAAIVIQSAYRSFSERTAFLIEKYAATTIQRVTRGVLTRINIEIEHFAATEIQRVWRGYDQFVEYVYVVFAAIKIQSHMRRCLAKNACESLQLEVWADQSYLKKKASIIQQAYRGYVLRKKMSRAASTIQRAFRDYLALWRANMLSRATIRLQAAFRAQAVRRKRNRSVVNVARKVLRAKKRAMEDPKQRLGCRTSIALTVLETSTSLAEIMDAVKTLESSTRLSINCCEVFTNTSAANILLDLIRACNRSLPHVELVHWILLTLENVGQHDRFLHCFSHCNSAEVFLDKVQMFRDKDGIFCLSISLLRRMIYTDQSVLVSHVLISLDRTLIFT
jgi:abnormal spindle-like microcephaly-associated protein